MKTVFNYLIQSGILGSVIYAVYGYVSGKKRDNVDHTYDHLKDVALRNASVMVRRPDATNELIINALINDLKVAQGKWYYHTFSDSTLGIIARETLHALNNDPNITKFANSQPQNNVAVKASNDEKAQSNDDQKQAPEPKNLDAMIAQDQETK